MEDCGLWPRVKAQKLQRKKVEKRRAVNRAWGKLPGLTFPRWGGASGGRFAPANGIEHRLRQHCTGSRIQARGREISPSGLATFLCVRPRRTTGGRARKTALQVSLAAAGRWLPGLSRLPKSCRLRRRLPMRRRMAEAAGASVGEVAAGASAERFPITLTKSRSFMGPGFEPRFEPGPIHVFLPIESSSIDVFLNAAGRAWDGPNGSPNL